LAFTTINNNKNMAWHSLLQGQLLISDTLKYNTRSQPEDNMCDLL